MGRADYGSESKTMSENSSETFSETFSENIPYDIVLITREGCSFCVKGKKVLKEADMIYTEIQIGKDTTRDEVLAKYPLAKLLPIFILNDAYMGSYDELYDWVTGELNKNHSETGGCTA